MGVTSEDLAANFWRDKGHPPFMKPPEADFGSRPSLRLCASLFCIYRATRADFGADHTGVPLGVTQPRKR